jgi:hypothetical protein
MEKYGPQVELNPLVRHLIARGGSIVGSIAMGVVFPSVCIVAGLDALDWEYLLAFYVGVRSWLAVQQMSSLRFEAQVDANLREISEGKSLTPPRPSVSDNPSVKPD